jgi:hypothetical protein
LDKQAQTFIDGFLLGSQTCPRRRVVGLAVVRDRLGPSDGLKHRPGPKRLIFLLPRSPAKITTVVTEGGTSHARWSRAKIKPERWEDAKAYIRELESLTARVPDIQYWLTTFSPDGEVSVLAVYRSEAALRANAQANVERWDYARQFFDGEPEVHEGEVIGLVPLKAR